MSSLAKRLDRLEEKQRGKDLMESHTITIYEVVYGDDEAPSEMYVHGDSEGEYIPVDLPAGWGLLSVESSGVRVFGQLKSE